MAKIFNVTGPCIPSKHYMADMSEQIAQIRKMVDEGAYFTINRARQYVNITVRPRNNHSMEKLLC